MKISLFLQLANFFVGHTYFGSRELQFKPKFDPVAQMVQELSRNIRAHRVHRAGERTVISELYFFFTVDYFSYFIYLFWLTRATI